MGGRIDPCILDDIIHKLYNTKNSAFINAMIDAWSKADADDKRILTPAWVTIIEKYGLDKEVEG